MPAPGIPCWVDAEPYPFGSDGNPVDTRELGCATFPQPTTPPGPDYQGYDARCYLRVTSLSFRAWNRGLAATKGLTGPTPFVVWLFNGTRWYPDPTFPGPSTCGGNTVLWAGKLDYWLVGSNDWGSLCRFDGSSFTWQPLSVPPATLAKVGVSQPAIGTTLGIKTGACFAWNDCWFFGSFGAILRWDGAALSDATPGLTSAPWLRTPFTSAARTLDEAGSPVALAGAATGGSLTGEQVPPRPGPAPPPQLYASAGGAFSPLEFTPPTVPQPGDPYRTDVVAVDIDARRHGWAAANPAGRRIPLGAVAGGDGVPFGRLLAQPEPAPLLAVSPNGADPTCGGPPAGRFMYMPDPRGTRAYLWSAVAVVPGSRDALAGGRMRPGVGNGRNDEGFGEPVLVRARCDGTVAETRFRVPDPTVSPSTAPLVPANRGGSILGLAAMASNDAWAATSEGELARSAGVPIVQRPHLYRLTDGAPPAAATGDDVEARPIEIRTDPPIFIEEAAPEEPPPVVAAAPPPRTVVTKKTQKLRQKSPIYAVRPLKARATGPGRFLLAITFKVRRPVTIGLQGLRRGKVVTSSGLKRFRGARGRLQLKLDRRRWPTKLRFYFPGGKASKAPRVVREPR